VPPPIPSLRRPNLVAAALLATLLLAPTGQYSSAAPAGPAQSLAVRVPAFRPAYFRPVIVGGQAFPVARSNFLSLLEIPNNWHAPRLRLIDGKWMLVGLHEGIDIAAERGTPVLSMTSGVVENTGWTFYSGTRVGVLGDDGRYYLYAHLSALAHGVAPGARVAPGSVLGLIGNTGYGPPGHRDEFPPHLHFGILAGPEWVNPYPTLVELYRATVRETDRGQAALDELTAAGKGRGWERTADRLYMGPDPLGGE
jgi:murein DD-endopeptidase MepM/ murein hydrolase activator NlpD